MEITFEINQDGQVSAIKPNRYGENQAELLGHVSCLPVNKRDQRSADALKWWAQWKPKKKEL